MDWDRHYLCKCVCVCLSDLDFKYHPTAIPLWTGLTVKLYQCAVGLCGGMLLYTVLYLSSNCTSVEVIHLSKIKHMCACPYIQLSVSTQQPATARFTSSVLKRPLCLLSTQSCHPLHSSRSSVSGAIILSESTTTLKTYIPINIPL